MRKPGQPGFAALETLLIIIIVTIVGFTSWFVWHSKHNADQTYAKAAASTMTVTNKLYTDTAHKFSFAYPSDWKLTPDQASGEGTLPDWTKESRPVTLKSRSSPKDAIGAHIQLLPKDMADSMIAHNKIDKFHTVQQLKLNGHDAYSDKLVFVGPSAAEKYTDDSYVVFNGVDVLYLTFRESYYHNSPAENWNDSKDLGIFLAIAKSIKFLN